MNYTDNQLKAIKKDNGDILVSASAGSGKTSVMIERIVRLVIEKKAKVSEILAVTFTDSAGAEMKEKLKTLLQQKISEGNKFLAQELNSVRSADICTIDSFCSRLVRSYFYQVGVSPDYEICDKNKAEELKEQAVANIFRKHYQQKDELVKFVDRYASKRNDSSMREMVIEMYDKISTEACFDDVILRYSSVTFDEVLKELLSIIKTRIKAIKEDLENYSLFLQDYDLPKGKDFLQSFILICESLVNVSSIYDVFDHKSAINKFSFEPPDDEALFEVREKIHNLKKEVDEIVKKDYDGFLTNYEQDKLNFDNAIESQKFFLQLVKEFKNEFDRLKREENLFDFSDLEHFALSVLQNSEILSQVKQKYKYIFVDEYQDINGIQEEIITTIKNDNLFMVGDEKQSIYGFRGCVPEFFTDKFKKMEKEGENAIKLNDNFRSAKKIIECVNSVFSYCMTEKNYGINYQLKSSLIYGKGYKDYDGRAFLHLLFREDEEKQKEQPRIYNIKEEVNKADDSDDNLTVSLITNIINEELGKEYYDIKKEQCRKITFGDIVILSRDGNGKYIDGIIKGLISHGIEVSASAEEDVCSYPEVIKAINFLRLVDCFYQDIPLVSVLKSKVVNCNEDELSTIIELFVENAKKENIDYHNLRFTDAFLYYLKNGEGILKEKLQNFYDYINKIRFLSDFATAGEVLEKVFDDFNIYPQILASTGGDIKVDRLSRVIAYCNEKAISIKALLRQIDSGDKKITLSCNGDENSVRVMTIHASKGLEFPVVILCGMEKQFNKEDLKGDFLFQRDYGFAFKSFDDENRTSCENALRKLFKQKISERIEKEEERLLYVALTRAKYALHMTAVLKEDKRLNTFDGANRYIDFIPLTFPVREHKKDDLAFVNIKKHNREVIISQETNAGTMAMKERFAFKYAYLTETTLPIKTNVTEVNKTVKEENVVNLYDENDNTTSASQGIVAHKIMEHYAFNKEPFDVQIEKMVKYGIISKEEASSIDLSAISKICESNEFKQLSNYKLYREQGFICKIKSNIVFNDSGDESEIMLQGVLDLLVIDGENAQIIDYKYSKKGSEQLANDYKKQLDLYAYAVENVLNKKVQKKIIVSLLNGNMVEIV